MTRDYRDYVIKNGKFIGKFEEMYQNCDDPWQQDNLNATHNLHKKLSVDLLKILGIRFQTMADLGCGKGTFTHLLHSNLGLKKSYGLDISPTAIEIAKSRYPDIIFLVSDLDRLSHRLTPPFDLIVISELFWYVLPEIENIIQQLGNLLADNGIIMVIQHFYQNGEQKYGKAIMSSYEDLLAIFSQNSFDIHYTVETNRTRNHDTITILRRRP